MHYTMLTLASLALAVSSAQAYQTMRIPNPLRYTFNGYLSSNAAGKENFTAYDNLTAPLTKAQFPCKGYWGDMYNDPSGLGQPTDSFMAGEDGHIILTGPSTGGSGQISMSGNNGSLTVIHSFEGSVGIKDQQELDFTFPSDAPTGTVVLSFTYFPLGSSEVFQSCASVILLPAENTTTPSIPFASRPDIFIANLDNNCTTDPTKEVMFPDPGPDFTMNHTVPIDNEVSTVIGTCLPVNGYGNGDKDNATKAHAVPFPKDTTDLKAKRQGPDDCNGMNSTSSSSSAPTATASPAAASTDGSDPNGAVFNVLPTAAVSALPTVSTAATTPTTPVYPISTDGACGASELFPNQVQQKCPTGQCCSMYGFCGTGANYCGSFTCSLQAGFGECSKFDNGTNPTPSSYYSTRRSIAGRISLW
jgi:hypothetical protein